MKYHKRIILDRPIA